MLTVGLNLKPRVKKGFDSDAQAFFTRVTVAGGTLSATEKLATNQLVLDLKSAGIWTSMKAIYPMVGASAAACAQNLKSSSFTGSFTSGWTFASTGVTPNGTSAYFDTTLNTLNDLSLNNYSFGYYISTNNTTTGLNGTDNITSSLIISPRGTITFMGGGNNFGAFSFNDINSLGLYHLSRLSATLFKTYKDNILKNTITTSSGVALPNLPIYLSALNKNSIPQFYDNRKIAFGYIGNGLNDTESSNIYTAVQTFQTTLSRAVGPQIVSDADAQAYINRVYTAGGTLTNTEATAVNQLTIDMKASNVWTSMKAVYPMIGSSAASCAQNLKSSSFTGTFTSGWTFASTGVTGNGTSAYMNTNYNQTTAGDSLNSAHLSFYSRTNVNTAQVEIGIQNPINTYNLLELRTAGITYFPINTIILSTYTDANSLGFYVGNRQAATDLDLWKNGTKVINGTTISSVLPNANIYIGAMNNLGSAANFSTKQCAFSSIGDGLTDLQASDFYTNVQTFNTTLSRQV
jgi:hypothetical protein